MTWRGYVGCLVLVVTPIVVPAGLTIAFGVDAAVNPHHPWHVIGLLLSTVSGLLGGALATRLLHDDFSRESR